VLDFAWQYHPLKDYPFYYRGKEKFCLFLKKTHWALREKTKTCRRSTLAADGEAEAPKHHTGQAPLFPPLGARNCELIDVALIALSGVSAAKFQGLSAYPETNGAHLIEKSSSLSFPHSLTQPDWWDASKKVGRERKTFHALDSHTRKNMISALSTPRKNKRVSGRPLYSCTRRASTQRKGDTKKKADYVGGIMNGHVVVWRRRVHSLVALLQNWRRAPCCANTRRAHLLTPPPPPPADRNEFAPPDYKVDVTMTHSVAPSRSVS
jgi:hypothetical protein